MAPIDAAIGFLGLLDPEQRTRVQERSRTLQIRKGQIAIEHGSRSTDVFFLAEGEVRVLLYSPDGREVSVRTLWPGQMFGELAAIDGLPRSATVIAVVPSLIIAITRDEFKRCIESSAQVALWLAHQFASQIRALTDRIFELSTLSVRNRLHCELLRLALLTGVELNRSNIKPAPTHAELANRIGTHREAVTRELRDLFTRKIVRQGHRQLEVIDFAQLSQIVNRLGSQSLGIYPAPKKPSVAVASMFMEALPN